MVNVCGSVDEEDGILGIDEGCGIVQTDSPVCVILAATMHLTIPPVLKGMGMHVVLLSTWDEDMECVEVQIGSNQQLEWGMGPTCKAPKGF